MYGANIDFTHCFILSCRCIIVESSLNGIGDAEGIFEKGEAIKLEEMICSNR